MLLGIKRIMTVVNKLATDVVKYKRAVSVAAKSGNLEAVALGAVSRARQLAHPALGAVSRPRPTRPPGARRGSPDPAGVPDRQVSCAVGPRFKRNLCSQSRLQRRETFRSGHWT